MKILAVNDWCHVVIEFQENVPPLHLLVISSGPPRYVMDGSYGNSSGPAFGNAE
jgi:hypothetical protein